jgi:hypothetical protein
MRIQKQLGGKAATNFINLIENIQHMLKIYCMDIENKYKIMIICIFYHFLAYYALIFSAYFLS